MWAAVTAPATPLARHGAFVVGVDIALTWSTPATGAHGSRGRDRVRSPDMDVQPARAARDSALWDELLALFTAQNRSGSSATTVIPATFLRVTVQK